MSLLRRSVMTLYSGATDLDSHRVRIVLAEKGVTVDILNVEFGEIPEDLHELNPYNTIPTLIDRDLVLYQANIIMEYLDERFPHPPLLPVYPVARAKSRLMMHRIEQDWYSLVKIILTSKDASEVERTRHNLSDSFVSLNPVFADKPYFLSDEFTLVDCCIASLLWRFPYLGIELPSRAKAVYAYMSRVFARQSFQASLTDSEREMREERIER